jgi:hypothetical protein
MPYVLTSPCITAKDPAGKIHYYYDAINPVIPWLSDADAERLIREGMVKRVDGPEPDLALVRAQDEASKVNECIYEIGHLELPRDCGAPATREALRDAGLKFSNETIAAAVKMRKAQLSRRG